MACGHLAACLRMHELATARQLNGSLK